MVRLQSYTFLFLSTLNFLSALNLSNTISTRLKIKKYKDSNNPIYDAKGWNVTCWSFENQTSARGYGYYPDDLTTVIQNILTNTTQPFVDVEPTNKRCSPQEWCDTETSILVAICGPGAADIALSGTDVAARLGYLHVAFQSTGNSDVTCNWQITEEAPGAFVAGEIRYVGSHGKESWSVQATKSNCSNVNDPVGWEASGLVQGPYSAPLKDVEITCFGGSLNFPSKVLTWDALNQTSHNIGIGLVKPVWDYGYQHTSECGQLYCDPATDVLVSLCDIKTSIDKWPTDFTSNLLNAALEILQKNATYYEHVDYLNPCLQLTPLPGVKSTSTKKHKNWFLYARSNSDLYHPDVFVKTLDAGQTCDQLLTRIQLDPSPVAVPESAKSNTVSSEYKEWLVYEPPQEGGFSHADLLSLKNRFALYTTGDDIQRASVNVNARVFEPDLDNEYRPYTEEFCFFSLCLDQTNIVVRLCGLWYPEVGLALSLPPGYENRADSDLKALSTDYALTRLRAFLCAPDGIGVPANNPQYPNKVSDSGLTVFCEDLKVSKAIQVDRALLYSDTYRAVLREYRHNTLFGPAVTKIENIKTDGHDVCDGS
ncbi:hypothetical protein TWF694_008961 [Orbilia ellipsospora]|uniref:Uncharacterized protein n=1 Tax=Orbilia ellipsospora TaxID=2528407 RepID=A0AAV9XDG4_9PEZI